ncbi:MAG TPA: hypothetical protein VIF62_12335 [Labilithrix sp.]
MDRPIGREDLTVLLSSALGQEKSEEVVVSAARELGIPAGNTYSAEEMRAIFQRLVTVEGLVGVVARFAISRGDVDRLARTARSSTPQRAAQQSSSTIDLIPLLAPAIGVEKAREAIESGAARLGLDAKSLSQDQALAVLELLAKAEGIVGVVARFAKARFLLTT